MSKVSLRKLLSKLTAIALSTSAVGPAIAADDTNDDLDSELRIDVEQVDPHDAGAALGRTLAFAAEGLRPFEATELVATWASSDDPVRRLAVAHALEWAFPLVGDALALEHLSRDADPLVRGAAARAARVRRVPLPALG